MIIDLPSSEVSGRARRRARRRKAAVWASFALLVAAPSATSAWYLYARAADQYASSVSFAVRSLQSSPAAPFMQLMGGVSDTFGDSEMLYEYLQSQPLVARLDAQIDLREIWNDPRADPLFRLGEDRSIEELTDYWNLAVTVSYDSSSGIIYVQPRAFAPEDARRIAEAVKTESERLVNALSTEAREDAVRFAMADLADAEARVREARMALQRFRNAAGTADVSRDIDAAMGLISQLKETRAKLRTEHDARQGQLDPDSVIMASLRRQITALDEQIAEEEARIADAGGAAPEAGGSAPSTLAEAVGEQEGLLVELQFAENMYTSALVAVETARAEARRAQRYLATHIQPTVSEEPQYPRRLMWTLAIFGLLSVAWAILMLIVSSVRDRH